MIIDTQSDPTLLPSIIGILILVPESFIIMTKFSRSNKSVHSDRMSLMGLMGTIFASICLAVPFVFFPVPRTFYFPLGNAGVIVTLAVLIIGTTIRW